jgi:molybdopterin synthase catalytic subunit
MTRVRIVNEALDPSALLAAFHDGDDGVGAIVSFTGQARGGDVDELALEHYPGMTERQIEATLASAERRWPVRRLAVVHRVGHIRPGEAIVWVASAAAHRAAAFSACEFVMDYLKVSAPLWKRERDRQGSWRWVEARGRDTERAKRWGGASPAGAS